MKFHKWLKVSMLALFISSSLCGCRIQQTATQQTFDAYLAKLPKESIEDDDLNLAYLFAHPQAYGFSSTLYNLPYQNIEDYKEAEDTKRTILQELSQFDVSKLSEEQQDTHAILTDYYTRSLGADVFYYLDQRQLGSYIGFQAQLPLLLSEYPITDKEDLERYFHILETSDESFQKYAQIEEERQMQGVGMSQGIMDKVIAQCRNFSSEKRPFLIDVINAKIDALENLDETEKTAAKQRNEELLQNSFVQAYAHLQETLETIDVRTPEAGLAHLPLGKEYYSYLVKKNCGIDDTIPQIKEYFSERLEKLKMQLEQLIQANPQVYQDLQETGIENLTYTKKQSFTEVIDYLGEQITRDFPDVGTLTYDITIVPDAMKDNFSPAAYLQGKIDADEQTPEHIWVNGDFQPSMFPTLAHEGYPGHMYQHTYFKQQRLPTIRYLIDYNGYSEGWATYVEYQAWKYADVEEAEKTALHMVSLNAQISACLISLMDIHIHYDGYSYEQYVEEMKQNFTSDETKLKEQWYNFLETPSNYLQYYLNGAKYTDLYEEAKAVLKEKFDSRSFHKILLEDGPVPYSFLKEKVDAYITQTSL